MEKFDSKKDDWDIAVMRHPNQFGYMLRVGRRLNPRTIEMASMKVEQFELHENCAMGHREVGATTAFTQVQVQELMDSLWQLGIRPSGYGDSATISQARDAILKIAEKLGVEL